MFESKSDPLASLPVFLFRLIKHFIFGLLVFFIGLGIGMYGYHTFEPMTWIDAFYNASLILSDMGPVTPLKTEEGKLFLGIYALFCGLAFVTIISIMIAPIIHRMIHSFFSVTTQK